MSNDSTLNDSEITVANTVNGGINSTSVFIGINDEPITATVNENQTVAYDIDAYTDDGATLSYSLSGSDSSLFSIDASTGVVTFDSAPDFENPNDANGDNAYELRVQLTVSNGLNSASQNLIISVANQNDNAPVVSSSTTASVSENQTAAYSTLASDADNDTLTYSLSGADADLFSIDVDTGVVTFNNAPDFEAPGDADDNNEYQLTVTASDGVNSTDQAITIAVTNENDHAPVFSSGTTATVSENQTAAYTALATDVEGDALTYSLSGADASLFSMDDTTGDVTFNSAPDFETPTDADGDNRYELIVTASDGLHSTSQNLSIDVTNVAEAPVFQSATTTTIEENQDLAYTALATDSDGDPVSYLLIAGGDANLFSLSLDGTLTFNNAPDFENPADANGDNVYEVNLLALSGSHFASQSVSIEVTNENDITPVFSSGTTASASENLSTEAAAYTALATDGDGDALSYSLSGTDAALFSIDASTGVVTFNAAPDFENPADADGDNIYDLIVTASDGLHSTSQNLGIEVTNVNEAPVFQSGGATTLEENQALAYTAQATDVDGDALSYSLTGEDAALFSIDATSGEVTFNSAPDFENPADTDGDNVYQITAIASDGVNSTSQDISIDVTNVAEAPVFESATTAAAAENQGLAYTALATDSDGDPVTYFLLSSADSALFSLAADGTLTFNTTPDFENPADANGDNLYEINLLAISGTHATSHSVSIEVTNENDHAPVFSSGTTATLNENQTAAYTALATDDDGDALTYSLSGDDAALFSIDTSSGVVTFNSAPDFENPADADGDNGYELTVTASDGINSVDQAVSITVTDTLNSIELSDVENGSGGFVINGVSADDVSGRSVSNAGDVNGDGLDDLIVGANWADPNGDLSGASYVVFGKTDGTAIELSAVENGTGGFVINGVSAEDRSGFSISNAGDVNGDGLDDLIVSADWADPNGDLSGASYVVFGKADGTAIELSDVENDSNQSGGFVINGVSAGDRSGISVSNAGDVNADGLDDLIVGAYWADPNGTLSGASFVVFGKTDDTAIELSKIEGDDIDSGGFVINGVSAVDLSGWSVSNAGDVNADGLDDLIIGAQSDDPNGSISGASFVVFGKTDGTAIELSEVENNDIDSGGFVINGVDQYDLSGYSVSNAGDVNADGFDDLIIGAPYADADDGSAANSGASFVVFGTTRTDTIELSEIENNDNDGGFVINGVNAEDRSGFSVSNAGDVNGDGLDDLIVGADWADPNGSKSGASYVVFGKADGTAIDLAEVENGTGGFVINGVSAGDRSGISVSNAGDVNADGFDDLIIGAPYADADDGSAANSGASFVVFGGQHTNATVGTSDDDLLEGDTSANQMVAGLGDDTLIGNGGADVLRSGAGDDVLAISDTDFAVINGGNGVDTLRFDAAIDLDFTEISDNLITGIEQIDLTADGGNSELTLNLTDVLSLSDTSTLENPLYISGNSGDQVNLIDASYGQSGTWVASDDGATFMSGDNALAHILIDDAVTVDYV